MIVDYHQIICITIRLYIIRLYIYIYYSGKSGTDNNYHPYYHITWMLVIIRTIYDNITNGIYEKHIDNVDDS